MFVEVAVNLPPVRGTFDYHLPPALRGHVVPGHLVTAPFGKRRVQGVVVANLKRPSVPETRPIEALVDPDPVLTPAQLELAHWLKAHTLSPLIDCLTLMLPPGLSQQADSLYTLIDTESQDAGPSEQRLLALLKRRGALRGRQIARAMSRMNWRRAADALVRRGIIERTSVLDPPRARPRTVRTARLAVPPQEARQSFDDLGRPGGAAAQRRRAVLQALIQAGEPVEVSWLYAEFEAKLRDLRFLEQRDLVALGEAEVWRDPLEEVDFVPGQAPQLTSDQAIVWDQVQRSLSSAQDEDAKPILLHGVTGSGKTEIYLRAVEETLRLGRQAIILVPEIALTPQTIRRFLARFPGQVGLVHSQLSEGERYDTWRRSRQGRLQVIVGPRSALFSPLANVGLIVLDESHDESYKEHARSPRYHARDTAVAYARILRATCILGSATPDVVSTFRSQQGLYTYLALPQRILGHRKRLSRQAERLGVTPRYSPSEGEADSIDLPDVQVVDMRQELRAGNTSMFSRALLKALTETLGREEQAILFLNRRGTSTYVFCRDCGYVLRCPRCETTLTYHGQQERLRCHHCGYTRQSPNRCPRCKSSRVKHFGAGTQSVEAEVRARFPRVRTLRWDWDATRSKGAHDAILSDFASHNADVLVGTQMIAKGLDLPLVTLVGVVSADVGVNLPEYRAAERSFQILTQVAGRAGRGLLGGRVILQSYQPDHYVIQAAAEHDYRSFYTKELRHRKQLRYPPFARLTRLVFRHTSESHAEEEARRMAVALREEALQAEVQAEFIGPVPCFYRRRRGYYRWHIVLRAEDPGLIIPEEMPEGWAVDVDPVTLL